MRVERPSVPDYTTVGNDYVDVPFTKEGSTDARVYWDAWHLAGVKILHFFATTKDLKVQILGSIDGTNFDTTLVAEFTLTAGSSTPVEKRIVAYWPYIKVQVKPSSSDQHGTLSVRAIGTTVSGESDTELTATIDPTGLATSAKQDSLIAKFPDQSGGKVPVLANINGDLPDTSASDLAHIHAAAESIKTAVEGATPAGSNMIGKVHVDYTRQASAVHRNAIATADKLIAPTLATKADVATGGALLANTTYYVATSPNTALGPCTMSNVLSQATASDASNTHCIDLTIPQVTNAISYGVFCSSASAPLWAAKITEAQRAAGCKITAVGTVESPSAGVAAGVVRIGAVGTGLATSATQFAANNAYVTAGLTGIVCAGYDSVVAHVALAIDDIRSAPGLTLATIFEDDQGVQYLGGCISVPILNGAVCQGFNQVYIIPCKGAAKLYILIGSISGQNASCTIRCERI